jgi:hypothetical protein
MRTKRRNGHATSANLSLEVRVMPDEIKPVVLSEQVKGQSEAVELPPREGDISLENAAKGSIADVIAIQKQRFSEEVGRTILKLFNISTITMAILVVALAVVDEFFILNGIIKPEERLITEAVVMSVIGATIIQVGAASFAIVSSLFKVPAAVAAEEQADK